MKSVKIKNKVLDTAMITHLIGHLVRVLSRHWSRAFYVLLLLILAACSTERPVDVSVNVSNVPNNGLPQGPITECQVNDNASVSAFVITPSGTFLLLENPDGSASRGVTLTTGEEISIEIQLTENGNATTIATASTVVPPPPVTELNFSEFQLSCPNVFDPEPISPPTPTIPTTTSDSSNLSQNLISADQVLLAQPPAGVRILSECQVGNNVFTQMGSPAVAPNGNLVTGGHNRSIVSACTTSGFRVPFPEPAGIEEDFASREVALDSAGSIFSYRNTGPSEQVRLLQFSSNGAVQRIFIGGQNNNAIRVSPSIDGANRVVYPQSPTQIAVATNIEQPTLIQVDPFGLIFSKGAISRQGVVYYTGTNMNRLLAVDLNNLQELNNQSCNTSSGSRSSPAIDSEGNIIFGTTAGRIYSCTSALEFNWVFPSPENLDLPASFWSSAVIDEANNVYIRSNNGVIYSVDSSGTLRWQLDTGVSADFGSGTPVIADDGRLFYVDSSGVNAVNKDTGERIWRFTGPSDRTFQDAGTSATLLPDGHLVFRAASTLFVVDVAGAGLSSSAAWPKWGRDLRNTSQQ